MKQLILAGFVLGMIFSGCSNSRITSSWNAPDIAPAKYKKIIVLGLIGDQDRRIREQMEMHLVGDLKSLGYHAVSSFTEFGPKAFDNLCEQDAVDKIKNSGADAVITVVLLEGILLQFTTVFILRDIMFPIQNIFGKVIYMKWLPKTWFTQYRQNLLILQLPKALAMNMEN